MNYSYQNKPLKVNEGDSTYCPYIKVPNNLKYTGIETPRDLNGQYLNEICVPNLSDRNMHPSFGKNTCINSKPIHLNFSVQSNGPVQSNCHYDNECKNKIETCLDPYM